MKLPLVTGQTNTFNPYVPGVMSLDWVPSFGDTNDPLNGVSLAAQEIYTKVREAYSGALEADAPDFMMYIGALDSIFAYLGWLKRLYRAVSTYSPDNFLLPSAIMHSQIRGGTSDVPTAIKALRARKDVFWNEINELILASQKFKCPAVMDIMNRHYWMSDNVFADAASPKGQLYVYTLRGVYKFAQLPIVGDTAGNTAAGLQMVQLPLVNSVNAETFYDTLYQFGMELISALDHWDDGYTISGYLRRAFEGSPNFAVALLEQKELITASYNTEVLSQIENFRAVHIFGNNGDTNDGIDDMRVQQDVMNNVLVATNVITWNISSDTSGGALGYAKYLVSFALPNGLLQPNVYINSRSDAPSVGDTVVASRMAAGIVSIEVEKNSPTEFEASITVDCGTEVPLRVIVYNYEPNTGLMLGNPVPPIMMLGQSANFASSGNQTTYSWSALMAAESFDWHPITLFIRQEGTTPAQAKLFPMLAGDIHNCAALTIEQLHALHRICIFSELNAFTIT